jgi:hypothetical protein
MIDAASPTAIGAGAMATRAWAWRSQPDSAAKAPAAGATFGSRGQPHQFGVAQVEGEMRRTLVALARIDFEAMQDDFLQPWRQIRPQAARRQRRSQAIMVRLCYRHVLGVRRRDPLDPGQQWRSARGTFGPLPILRPARC